LARVGDLVDFGPKNDCPDDTEVGFVPLQRLGVDYRSRHTFEPKPWLAVKKGYTHFADGDVLLARITPSFENGQAGIVRGLPNGIGAGSTEYFVCRPTKDVLLPEYLLAHFKTPQFLQDGEQVMSGAVGQQRVPKQYVLDSELRLAPFNEQKRIADKLDAVFAQVDACREHLDRVPAILKRFRQAVLAAATSGKLTEEWRASDEVEAWQTVKLSGVAKSRLGKMLDKAKNQGTATPYLRNINVRWFGFDLSDIQAIRVTEDEVRELAVARGDVLICEGGEPGRCAVWQGEDGAYVYQKALHRVRVGPALTPEWLCYSLKDAADSGHLTDLFTGTTIKHLTGVSLGQFEFPLPPLREQHEIIRRVETLFAYADRLEARYTAARIQVEHLTPALLAKAFRGELVPQDPNDEPASILLERIRAARGGRRDGRSQATQRQ
jgi:type I restriction enzyme S subunit